MQTTRRKFGLMALLGLAGGSLGKLKTAEANPVAGLADDVHPDDVHPHHARDVAHAEDHPSDLANAEEVWRFSTLEWVESQVGRPENPVDGTAYIDKGDGALWVYLGGQWASLAMPGVWETVA